MQARLLLVALGAVTAAHHGLAQQEPTSVSKLTALRVEQVSPGLVRATGGASVQVNDWTLRAELLELRTASPAEGLDEVVAEGFVVFERGQDRLHVKRLRIDPRSGRGSFELHRP